MSSTNLWHTSLFKLVVVHLFLLLTNVLTSSVLIFAHRHADYKTAGTRVSRWMRRDFSKEGACDLIMSKMRGGFQILNQL